MGRVLCTNFGAGVAEDGVPVRYAHNIGWANGQPRLVSGDPGRASAGPSASTSTSTFRA